MSRWTFDPPDTDRYEEKPLDAADVPQDDPPVDRAEHAAQAAMAALADLDMQVDLSDAVERMLMLKRLAKALFNAADAVDKNVSAKLDTIMERRR